MYKLTENGVKRLTDGAFIPNDPRNKDWREYQEWLKAGNTPEPADPPEPVLVDMSAKIQALKNATTIAELKKALLDYLGIE